MNLHSLLKWPRVHHHHSKMEALPIQLLSYWEFLAGSVIQAAGMVEFENCLMTGVHLGGCRCNCGDKAEDQFQSPLGVWVGL